MKDITQSRLSSVLTVLVGTWLLLSPIWISITGGALVSLFITGGIITLAGLVQLFTDYSIPSYIVILSAIWLFLSAFVFTTVSNAVIWNEIAVAVATFLLASWDAVEITSAADYRRHHPRPI